jgi:hypothetical protein
MATRGGRRPNAGRKAGAITKRSREIADKALDSGLTPLDYMLERLRDQTAKPVDRMDAAKAAAPYIHPRLETIKLDATISKTPEQALSELDQPTADDAP